MDNEKLLKLRKTVADFSGVTEDQMCSTCRRAEIVIARQRFCYLGRYYGQESLRRIGELIGARDHTTVIHSARRMRDILGKYPKELRLMNKLERKATSIFSIQKDEEQKKIEKLEKLTGDEIHLLIKNSYLNGFEAGKKYSKPPQIIERVVIRKIYVDEDQPKVKQERAKAVYSNPQYVL